MNQINEKVDIPRYLLTNNILISFAFQTHAVLSWQPSSDVNLDLHNHEYEECAFLSNATFPGHCERCQIKQNNKECTYSTLNRDRVTAEVCTASSTTD